MSKWEERTLIEKGGAIAVALTGILTLVFLLFPGLKPEFTRDSPPPAPTATPISLGPSEPKPSAGDVILGTWQQYGWIPATQQWDYFGTFVVARNNGAYTMSAREQREDPQLLNSIGIFDVQSDGTTWTFNSNWGRGDVGNFSLQKLSNTLFEGDISVRSQVVGRTKWVRIQ